MRMGVQKRVVHVGVVRLCVDGVVGLCGARPVERGIFSLFIKGSVGVGC